MTNAKKSKTGKRKEKIDWLKARKHYLSDASQSYRTIAIKYNVSVTSVQKRGTAEGWSDLRQELAEKSFDAFQEKLLETKSNAQSRHLTQFQNAQAVANALIYDMAKMPRARDIDGNVIVDDDGNEVRVMPQPLDLQRATSALKDAIMGERVVLGLPTSVNALTDEKGDNAFQGFSDMLMAARKVNERARKKSKTGDRRNTRGDSK